MNTFKLKIQTPLTGREVIQKLQALGLHVEKIEKQHVSKQYPPLTKDQMQMFKIFTLRGYPAHFIFQQLGQIITPERARAKAKQYRKKLKLKEYTEVPPCMVHV